MLTAEAVIPTGHPDRYIARLCRHASQMGQASQGSRHLRHRTRAPGGNDTPPEVRHAEWSGTHGTVTLNWGRWTLQAVPGALTVRAEAAAAKNLRRIPDLPTARLESFGRREHLTVNWQQAPSGEPSQAS